ncbi:MAG: hypothetical protein L0L10_09890 [Tetragenococcus sp.]|nr:hypothetical protein [Tetragenococcus sp.]
MWKRILLLRRYNLGLILSSFIYGCELLFYPEILETYRVYLYVGEIFDYKIISLAFIVLSTSNLMGVIFNVKQLRRMSVYALMFLWIMFGFSFVLTMITGDQAYTVTVLAFLESYLAWCLNLREE